MKDLEICEQHSTFWNDKSVDKWGKIVELLVDGTNWGFHEIVPRYWKLRTIPTPRNFIMCRKILKQRTIIVLTTQMSKAFCRFEMQSKRILNALVEILSFATNM